VAQWLVAHHLRSGVLLADRFALSSAGVDALEDEGREIAFCQWWRFARSRHSLTEIRRACELNEVTVHDEDRAVFDTEIATIKAQIKSPSAKRKVVGGALRSLGGPLLHAGPGVLGGKRSSVGSTP